MTIADRVEEVLTRIQRAAIAAGRRPESVRLIGVTKGVGPEAIAEAAAAGVIEFGENRVQEALEKMEALGDNGAEHRSWHLIGRLQTNKVRAAVGRFGLIHSVDSLRLGQAIDDAAARAGIVQRILLQVNVGHEPQKGGVSPGEVETLWRGLAACRSLRVEGLMAIPPAASDAEASRPYFRELRRIGDQVLPHARGDGDGLPVEYSMGMSSDFEVAVQEGATIVRVGTAIFGDRAPGGAVPQASWDAG